MCYFKLPSIMLNLMLANGRVHVISLQIVQLLASYQQLSNIRGYNLESIVWTLSIKVIILQV